MLVCDKCGKSDVDKLFRTQSIPEYRCERCFMIVTKSQGYVGDMVKNDFSEKVVVKSEKISPNRGGSNYSGSCGLEEEELIQG